MDRFLQAAVVRKRAGIIVPVMLAVTVLQMAACTPEQQQSNVAANTNRTKLPITEGSAAECPDRPSQILLPLKPGEAGYSPEGAPPPDTTIQVVAPVAIPQIKVSYNTDLRELFDIPEYHDCQKLLRPGGAVYGPLAGIFSLDPSHPAYTTEQYQQRGGVAAALIYNFTNTEAIYPGQPPSNVSGAYNALIRGRRSCLYLQKTALPSGEHWSARLWHMPGSLPTCPETLSEHVPTLALTVIRTRPLPSADDYPPAARWDLSPKEKLQYMAVRCLDGWCEIGPGTFTTSAAQIGVDKYHTVKGWYDQQFLATNPGGGAAQPSKTMYGSLYPEANLNTLTIADYSCNPALVPPGEPFAKQNDPHATGLVKQLSKNPRKCAPPLNAAGLAQDDPNGFWRKVASIHITNADPAYKAKFMLDQSGRSLVYLRYNPALSAGSRWQVRYAPPSVGAGRVVKAVRMDHSLSTFGGQKLLVPATVRWKWVLKDEQAWNRCSEGCCSGLL